MAPTPESILFESLFFQWAQRNGEAFNVVEAATLIQEGVATPDLFLLVEGNAQVRTALESEETAADSVDLAGLAVAAERDKQRDQTYASR